MIGSEVSAPEAGRPTLLIVDDDLTFCRVLARPDGSTPDANHPEDWTPMPREINGVKVLPPDSVETSTSEQLAA